MDKWFVINPLKEKFTRISKLIMYLKDLRKLQDKVIEDPFKNQDNGYYTGMGDYIYEVYEHKDGKKKTLTKEEINEKILELETQQKKLKNKIKTQEK